MDKEEGEEGRLLGPWVVARMECPQLYPYYLLRQTGILNWQKMLTEFGAVARFESYSEASAAAAAANANEPNG